jgi:hypothetical protein
MTAQEPQTKAESALERFIARWCYGDAEDPMATDAAAIEAEAREQAKRDIAALRNGMRAIKKLADTKWLTDEGRHAIAMVATELLKDTDEAEIRAEDV